MKTAILLTTLLIGYSGATLADVTIRGNLKTSDKDSSVIVYAGYEYTGDSKACMTVHFPEGEIKYYPIVSQRLIQIGTGSLKAAIPDSVDVGLFGRCKLELVGEMKVLVGKNQILKNVIKQGGKQLDKNTYEFKGAIGGIKVQNGTSSQNKLNCTYESGKLTATCNANLISTDANGLLELDVFLK